VAKLAHDCGVAAVETSDALDDGQSETASTSVTGASSVDSIESIKEPWQVFCRNADTRVRNDHYQSLIPHLSFNAHLPVARSVRNAILDEVADCALKERPIEREH
jgi:hypothetical protein